MLKKGFILLVSLVVIVAAFTGCGKSASKDPLIGEWTNDKDTLEFKADGTYSSYYYWMGGGQWCHAEDSDDIIEILNNLLGKERHRVTITDDELVLTQQYTDSEGEEKDTNMVYRFHKKAS